jgi:anti-sigma factor RsiW
MSDQDTTQISRYLLGQLPKDEVDRIESRLMTENGLFDLAETVEDEVIDRYVRGELAPEERRRFERRLLPSERIGERVALARALAAHAGRRNLGRTERARRSHVVPLFRPAAARLAWAASLVVLLLAGWLGVQLVGLHGQVDDIERARLAAVERAEELEAEVVRAHSAEAQGAEAAERTEALEGELAVARERIAELQARPVPVEPSPGDTRTERRVRKPGDYATLFFALATRSESGPDVLDLGGKEAGRLEIELGPPPAGPVRATVTRDGVVVWHEAGVEVEIFDGESMAVLVLPAQSLQSGRYSVDLREDVSDRPLGSHTFVVER